MQTIVFSVTHNLEQSRYEAFSRQPPLQIAAPTMEELHIEARDMLIEELGAVHVAFRIQFAREALNAPPSPRARGADRSAQSSRL